MVPDRLVAKHARLSSLASPIDLLGGSREDIYAFTHALMYWSRFAATSRRLPRPRAAILAEAGSAVALCLDEQAMISPESCSLLGRSPPDAGVPARRSPSASSHGSRTRLAFCLPRARVCSGAWNVGLPKAFTATLHTPAPPNRGFTHMLPKPQLKSLWQLGALAYPDPEVVLTSGEAALRHAVPDGLPEADSPTDETMPPFLSAGPRDPADKYRMTGAAIEKKKSS